MKPSKLRQWWLCFLAATWILHPNFICDCEVCKAWRKEHHIQKDGEQ